MLCLLLVVHQHWFFIVDEVVFVALPPLALGHPLDLLADFALVERLHCLDLGLASKRHGPDLAEGPERVSGAAGLGGVLEYDGVDLLTVRAQDLGQLLLERLARLELALGGLGRGLVVAAADCWARVADRGRNLLD